MALPTLEESRDFVLYAHTITAQGGSVDPARVATAEKLMRDAGEDPASLVAPRTATATATRTSAAAVAADDVLLGLDDAGRPLMASAITEDPVNVLRAPGISLTATGKTILERLAALPRERAKALKIDTAAITAYAKKAGIDPAVCLKAELERVDQLEKDLAILHGTFGAGGGPAASAPPTPAQYVTRETSPAPAQSAGPKDQLSLDRELMRQLGI